DGEKRVIDVVGAPKDILASQEILALKNQRISLKCRGQNEHFQSAIEKCIRWRKEPVGEQPTEVFRVDSRQSMNFGLLVQPTSYFPYASARNPHAIVWLGDAERQQAAPEHLVAQ